MNEMPKKTFKSLNSVNFNFNSYCLFQFLHLSSNVNEVIKTVSFINWQLYLVTLYYFFHNKI